MVELSTSIAGPFTGQILADLGAEVFKVENPAFGRSSVGGQIKTGRPFSAEQAETWGMVNAVVEPADLMPTVLALAQQIADNAPISVRQIKKAVHAGLQTDMTRALAIEVMAYKRTIGTEDRREGVRAFTEKRKPLFRGQ